MAQKRRVGLGRLAASALCLGFRVPRANSEDTHSAAVRVRFTRATRPGSARTQGPPRAAGPLLLLLPSLVPFPSAPPRYPLLFAASFFGSFSFCACCFLPWFLSLLRLPGALCSCCFLLCFAPEISHHAVVIRFAGANPKKQPEVRKRFLETTDSAPEAMFCVHGNTRRTAVYKEMHGITRGSSGIPEISGYG